jgi:UDPglucose--hexose-1-phosphate uridylyltransferase
LTEIRRNPITGEPVLFAPERAERPFAASRGECPFCPGEEHQTPPELARLGEPHGDQWHARVFPNKFPPIAGAEVIVESARHEAAFHDIDRAEDVLALYLERFRAHADAKAVVLFKNHGARAGASIAHLHSQLVPLPFVPPRIANEIAGFEASEACPMCDVEGHVIAETKHYTWLAPSASRMAWQQWIVPNWHVYDVRGLEHLDELADLLQRASRAMVTIADAYNWMFLDFRGEQDAHTYIELFPRMTTIAGFELGSGMFVEIVDPATVANKLSRRRGPIIVP